jgi:hypothetical protein
MGTFTVSSVYVQYIAVGVAQALLRSRCSHTISAFQANKAFDVALLFTLAIKTIVGPITVHTISKLDVDVSFSVSFSKIQIRHVTPIFKCFPECSPKEDTDEVEK